MKKLLLAAIMVGSVSLAHAGAIAEKKAIHQLIMEVDKATQNPDAMIKIPGQNMLMVTLPKGRWVFLSQDMKYLIKPNGEIWDLLQETKVSLKDIQSGVPKIDLAKLNFNPEQVSYYKVGKGKIHLSIFIDPLCPYCHRMLELMQGQQEVFTADIILLPVLGPKSESIVENLLCLNDNQRGMDILMKKDWDQLKSVSCDKVDLSKLDKSRWFGATMNIQAVPFTVKDNGETISGLPESPQQLQ